MSYRVSPNVQFRAVHDEVVLLDSRDDAYFALNPTGAVVWSVLAGGQPPEVAAAELVAQFGVSPEVARADAAALIDQLVARGLLEPSAE